MNDYEKKKQDRIDRYRERADAARAQSDALSKQSHDMIHAIPMGQPIMSAADARYREKAGNKMRQAIAADEKAAYYEAKAEAAENNTAISSDDPDAIEKLETKLEQRRTLQTYMKNVNAYYRKYGTCRGMDGITDEQTDKFDADVKSGLSWGLPFPSYALSNNNQEIHRLEARLRRLKEAREIGFVGWEFEGGKVVANSEANRLQIFFDDIPDEAIRKELKGWGFKWARSVGAWQRQLSQNAVFVQAESRPSAPLTAPTRPPFSQSIRNSRNVKENTGKGAAPMNVLVVEPRMLPYEKEVPDKLENLQAIVRGHIQAIYAFQDHVALVCNEDGIGEGLEFNRMIPERQYGGIFGTFFICGLGEENFISLTPEQMKTYKKRFQKAEVILAVNGGNPVIAKVTPIPKQPPEQPEHQRKPPQR